jgi:hypothetical protein
MPAVEADDVTTIVEFNFIGLVWHNLATTPANLMSLLNLLSARQMRDIALINSISCRTCTRQAKQNRLQIPTPCSHCKT